MGKHNPEDAVYVVEVGAYIEVECEAAGFVPMPDHIFVVLAEEALHAQEIGIEVPKRSGRATVNGGGGPRRHFGLGRFPPG